MNFAKTTKSHECRTCKKQFANERDLKVHKLTHVRKLECDVCEEEFDTNDLLIEHLLIHSREYSRFCKLWDQNYIDKYFNEDHIDTKSKPYVCKECKKEIDPDLHIHPRGKPRAKRHKEGMQQDTKPPSLRKMKYSCDKDDRADRCSSEPSPVNKIISEDKIKSQLSKDPVKPHGPSSNEHRSSTQSKPDPSPKGNRDYGSSATMCADQGLKSPHRRRVAKLSKDVFKS